MAYKGEAWVSDFELPVGTVIARALVTEDEPTRYQIHVLAAEWMPPMEVAQSVDQAKRRAVEIVAGQWPRARAAGWRPEVESIPSSRPAHR